MLITFPQKVFLLTESVSLFFFHPSPSSFSLSFCLSFYLSLLFCNAARSLSFLTLSSPSSATILLATTFFSVFTVQFLVPILPSFIVALFKLLMPRRQSSLLLSANEWKQGTLAIYIYTYLYTIYKTFSNTCVSTLPVRSFAFAIMQHVDVHEHRIGLSKFHVL